MPTALAVTDTHALLWWGDSAKQKKVGRRARAHFQRADQELAAIYVPTIVIAEISELVHLGRIELAVPFGVWLDALERSRNYLIADLTADVVRCANDLFAIAERGDRLIAATAQSLNVPLMTRDQHIGATSGVELLWD